MYTFELKYAKKSPHILQTQPYRCLSYFVLLNFHQSSSPLPFPHHLHHAKYVDLVTLTEEILSGKLHFLCIVIKTSPDIRDRRVFIYC